MQVSTIGLDLAKNVFQIHGVDASGEVVVRRKLRRGQLVPFFAGLGPCLVGMEACCGAHHWARELIALGHEVRLMPPDYVKPYVRRQKHALGLDPGERRGRRGGDLRGGHAAGDAVRAGEAA